MERGIGGSNLISGQARRPAAVGDDVLVLDGPPPPPPILRGKEGREGRKGTGMNTFRGRRRRGDSRTDRRGSDDKTGDGIPWTYPASGDDIREVLAGAVGERGVRKIGR